MKRNFLCCKRWLSLVLVFCLLLGSVPVAAFAEEAAPETVATEPPVTEATEVTETTEGTEATEETAEPVAESEGAAPMLLAEDSWDHIDTDALYNKISIAPGQLVGDTGEVVENEVYGYVANYPLKKGHILSISDESYVFSVRKLENGNYSNMLKAADTAPFTAKEDMTVAMLIRKPDKSPVTAEELADVVIYDSQFAMIGIPGSVHRFTVEAKTIDGGTATTRAAIFLPSSYSEEGDPTRLIVMTNGFHAHLTDSVWNKNTADNVGIIRSYLDAGYAVYVVDNTANGQVGTPDLGCPQLISSYWEAYDYIQNHFNVEEKISIHSRSFGTFAAVGLMRSCPERIKCALLTGPRISFAREWKSVDKAFVADRFGFADTTGATYEADKLSGFDPYTDVDAGDYSLPPTYWIMCQGDATEEPLTVIEKLKALGNDVQSVTHTGTDHTGVCTLNTEAMFADALAYLEAHQEDSATDTLRGPMHFAWEMEGEELRTVGPDENPLHAMPITTPDGWPREYAFSLEHYVSLRHDRPWSVEWKCEGNWQGTLFSGAYTMPTEDVCYLTRTGGGQLCFGTWNGSRYDNYGVDISWLDNEVHTFRLENSIDEDGSNMVWLYVDDSPVGPMENYFVGSNDQYTTSDWISGKDLTFFYIGTETDKIANCHLEYLEVRERGMTHAVPESRGVANAIARAHALTDVEWTPKREVPGVQEIDGEYVMVPFEAGVTYRGIPYSGTIATDTYVGLNVSLESFLTALENENSVLYTENLYSTNPKSASYFGTVCSKFAQYVLDVPGSYNTNNVANIPGMQTVAMPREYTVDQIRLGDVILDVVYHTAVCTGILYDENGEILCIEISEAVMPLVRRLWWTPEEFYTEFASYRLCRYEGIGEVPPVPELRQREELILMPRMGDQYNYTVSSTPGIVDVLDSSCERVTIYRDGEWLQEIQLNGAASFTFDRSVPGMLEMVAVCDGISHSVYACVVEASVEVTNVESFANGKLEVSFRGSSGVPLYVQVGSGQNLFCSVEGAEDSAWLYFSPGKVSNQKVRVAYQNEFGIYLSPWVGFTADTNPSKDPLLSKGQYWDGCNITPNSHIPAQQAGKEGYWTYTDIPVEGGTVYYSQGATRLWFLDQNGDPISTMNAYKDSQVPFQFTTPDNAAYVSIAYSPDLVEKGTECLEKISGSYRLEVPAAEVWIDGVQYAAIKGETGFHVLLEGSDAKIMTVYSYNDADASDPHTQYPTGMQVWVLKFSDGAYTAERLEEFDDLLSYGGASIRVTGVKGIRMITAIDKGLRSALMDGSLGYTLLEYGTCVGWASDLSGTAPVLGQGSVMHNYAYKKDVADPIFADTGDTIQYTNVLVGFMEDQLAKDLAMRPYMILEDGAGERITIYGGCVQRSIGYIAKQNQDTFPEGSKTDAYIEDIISKVYG